MLTYFDGVHFLFGCGESGAGDLNEELYLIVVVMRVGKILPSDSIKKSEKHSVSGAAGGGGGGSYGSSSVGSSGTGAASTGGSHSSIANYRRPYGVGVLSLADLCHFDSTMETEERDYTIKVSSDFRSIQFLLLHSAEKPPHCSGNCV